MSNVANLAMCKYDLSTYSYPLVIFLSFSSHYFMFACSRFACQGPTGLVHIFQSFSSLPFCASSLQPDLGATRIESSTLPSRGQARTG